MKLTIAQALQRGVEAHRGGRLQEAERFYRAILGSQPSHPDANHNLGVLTVSLNKAEAALPLFKTALEANPKAEQFWLSYIDALIRLNMLNDARLEVKRCRKISHALHPEPFQIAIACALVWDRTIRCQAHHQPGTAGPRSSAGSGERSRGRSPGGHPR